MRSNNLIAISVGLIVTLAGLAQADVIVGTSIGPNSPGWQPFPGTLNNYGNSNRPYWDQESLDSANRNIGNYVNGSYTPSLPGNGSVPGPGLPLEWWGYSSRVNSLVSPTSNEDPSFYLAATPGRTGVEYSLRAEVAGLSNYNEVGWYDTSSPIGSEVLHPIILGPNSPVIDGLFTPSTNWGLYIRSYEGFSKGSGSGLYFFTQSERNRATGFGGNPPDFTKRRQHFAAFALDKTPGQECYLVGIEDLPTNTIEKGGDYNDVIITLCTVPEPATMGLLALGLPLLRRRRR